MAVGPKRRPRPRTAVSAPFARARGALWVRASPDRGRAEGELGPKVQTSIERSSPILTGAA
eukprot:9427007-Alexandrium_andersonii.AAC.1